MLERVAQHLAPLMGRLSRQWEGTGAATPQVARFPALVDALAFLADHAGSPPLYVAELSRHSSLAELHHLRRRAAAAAAAAARAAPARAREAIGVRVPALPEAAASVVTESGCVVATSANLAAGPEPRRLDEVAPELLARVTGATVDAGELPGTPSTVLDFTDTEPRVIREGAAPAAAALERVARALA